MVEIQEIKLESNVTSDVDGNANPQNSGSGTEQASDSGANRNGQNGSSNDKSSNQSGNNSQSQNNSQSDQDSEGNGENDKQYKDSEKKPMSIDDYKVGDKIYAHIKSKPYLNKKSGKKEFTKGTAIWTILEKHTDADETHKLRDAKKNEFYVRKQDIKLIDLKAALDVKKQREEEKKRAEERKKKEQEFKKKQFEFETLQPDEKIDRLIEAGLRNLWLVGPAGCGKSTMSRNVAVKRDIPYLCISCGIGTSAAEFVGYKYPERQATKFADYYSKPSIILVDEITALDPAVGQVLNAALANDEIETTTGLVKRHPDCIIIATSNTFGAGADRQYVANNQLDASTIDRFTGGIIEVTYSAIFESRYDEEVVKYVELIREVIKKNNLRRVASTRMIQAGDKLKWCFFKDWRERLIVNWTYAEKEILKTALIASALKNEGFKAGVKQRTNTSGYEIFTSN